MSFSRQCPTRRTPSIGEATGIILNGGAARGTVGSRQNAVHRSRPRRCATSTGGSRGIPADLKPYGLSDPRKTVIFDRAAPIPSPSVNSQAPVPLRTSVLSSWTACRSRWTACVGIRSTIGDGRLHRLANHPGDKNAAMEAVLGLDSDPLEIIVVDVLQIADGSGRCLEKNDRDAGHVAVG